MRDPQRRAERWTSRTRSARGAAGVLRGLALCALTLAGASTGRAQEPEPPFQGPPPPPAEPTATPQTPENAARPAQPGQERTPIVRAIRVEGAQRYNSERLIEALGQRIGMPLNREEIDRGIEALWKSFHVRPVVAVRPVEGGVELVLTVVEMPSDLEPRFIGNDEIDLETLRKWAGLEERTELFLYQAPMVRQRLLEGYHREGFYFTEIEIVTRGGAEEAESDLADVIFEIREGPKVRVKEVIIEGNVSLPDKGILFWKDGLNALAKTELDGPWLFNWLGSPFVVEQLNADLLAMRNVYRDRGFLDAVVEVEDLKFSAERDDVRIPIRIDEGQPYRVSSLAIRAFEWENPASLRDERLKSAELVFPEEELIGLASTQPGEIFDSTHRAQDLAVLRELYGATGRISHPSLARGVGWEFLDPELVFDREKHTVAVTYRIVQGLPIRIREILFDGTKHTRDKVLRRELSVFPGQIANLTEIQKSLGRIVNTDYFSDQFNDDHPEPSFRFRPVEGDPRSWDLEFVVEEGRVVDVSVSGGVSTDSGLFGVLSLKMRNFDASDWPSSIWGTFGEIYRKEAFHGGGQQLDLEIAPGTDLSRFLIRFKDPDIFDLYENPIGFDFSFLKSLRDYDYYLEDRIEGSVSLRRALTRELSVSGGIQLSRVEVSDLDNNVPPLLDQEEQDGALELRALLGDLAYRNLDSFMSPREGFKASWSIELYGQVLGGDASWFQSDFTFDHYYPFSDPRDGPTNVLHTSLDFGSALPFGSTDDVPYTERYFLGGSRTLRGFAYRGVGPMYPPSDDPLGGETFIAGTVEIQFPLYSVTQPGSYFKREALRGTLFVDFGELDEDPYELDIGTMRASVGFGIGLAYPIPVTVSFAWPILDEPGDQTQVFAFTIGF